MFPTLSNNHSPSEFTEYALKVRSWFLKFPKLNLTPLGLEQMALNHIVIAPMSRDHEDLVFYRSVFHCELCDFKTSQVADVRKHCDDFGHQKRLYGIYREKVKLGRTSPSTASSGYRVIEQQIELPKENGENDSFSDHQHSHDPCPDYNLKSLPAMGGFACEQCVISTPDAELFLLHLRGFGHQRRQRESSGIGPCQPMRDAGSGTIFYFQPSTNRVFDEMQPLYPGERRSICEIVRATLTGFVHCS